MELLRIDSGNIAALRENGTVQGLPWGQLMATTRPPWIDHSRPYAYALLKNGVCIGSLLTIYAIRVLDGHKITVCNLSTWYVDPEHRQHSMRLLLAALQDARGIPVTVLTPSGVATQIYQALRFRVADSERLGIPLNDHPSDAALRVETNPDSVFLALSPQDKQVFNDHRGFNLQHCRIEGEGNSCYFVYGTRERFEKRVADLLYASGDSELLLKPWQAPEGSPLRACDTLLVDRRVLGDGDVGLPCTNPFNPRLYFGPPALGPKLDFLYSEVPIFNSSLM